nr:hypothetical protein [Actinomyces sp.]
MAALGARGRTAITWRRALYVIAGCCSAYSRAVAELTSEKCPVPVKRIGVPDQWAPTGSEAWLMDHWGISADGIVAAAHDLRS